MADKQTKKAKYADILIKPHMTEKANNAASKNVHTFDIAPSATKGDVAKAIDAFYGVAPVKIAIVNLPKKKVFVRGKVGFKNATKKAYVYLKEGDKIE